MLLKLLLQQAFPFLTVRFSTLYHCGCVLIIDNFEGIGFLLITFTYAFNRLTVKPCYALLYPFLLEKMSYLIVISKIDIYVFRLFVIPPFLSTPFLSVAHLSFKLTYKKEKKNIKCKK